MQLKIQRSQRSGGVLGNTVFFCLDVRADYSSEEQSNISKYKLGGEIIYSSQAARKHAENAGAHYERTQTGSAGERAAGLARLSFSAVMARLSLNISIASLGRGHHIECKDLQGFLEAEDTVRTACKNVTRYLEAAATFNGSETVIEYEKGEERIHIAQNAPPLLEYHSDASDDQRIQTSTEGVTKDPLMEMGGDFRNIADMFRARWLALERKIIAFANSKGWKVSEVAIRAVGCLLGLTLFILLIQVL